MSCEIAKHELNLHTGIAVLAGLGSMVLLIFVNGFIANNMKILQMSQMQNKDERAKLMNEVLLLSLCTVKGHCA